MATPSASSLPLVCVRQARQIASSRRNLKPPLPVPSSLRPFFLRAPPPPSSSQYRLATMVTSGGGHDCDWVARTAHELVHGRGFVVVDARRVGADLNDLKAVRQLLRARASAQTANDDDTKTKDGSGGGGQVVVEDISSDPAVARLASLPLVASLADALIGKNHRLSKVCGNVLLPGAAAQEPHLDFPYGDGTGADNDGSGGGDGGGGVDSSDAGAQWRGGIEPAVAADRGVRGGCGGESGVFGLQCVFFLTNFTRENGGTRVVGGSQRWRRWPSAADAAAFPRAATTLEGPAGSLAIYTGLLHHAAGRNTTQNEARAALLVQLVSSNIEMLEQVHAAEDVGRRGPEGMT